MVYEPREDSELLAQAVRKHAHGRVIDVGTGSGIQARTAQNNSSVTHVQATDINPQAVKRARQEGVDAQEADLFLDETTLYDTIICNAPYLPDEPLAPDVALDGGKKGYEWTLRFLEQARTRLAREGQILLLISTLTNPHVINEWLLTNALTWQVIAQEKHSFEELLVYQITHALPKHPNAQYLAKGKRSRVYKVGGDVIKLAAPRRVLQEAHMLQQANQLGLGPTYKEHTDTYVRMSFVQGTRIDVYAQQATTQQLINVLRKLMQQAKTLDDAQINKKELTNPYKHVLITAQEEVVQIDWERARKTLKPQNQAQLKEYIKKLREQHPTLPLL